MATFEIEIDGEKIHELLREDREMAVLLEPILNQILQAEMTEHLKAKPGEQTSERREYRNGTYERKLTTRVGTIELEVPRDREGTFQTALFQRYQRSEKTLVWAFHADGGSRSQHSSSQRHHTELCGRGFSKWAPPAWPKSWTSKSRRGPSAHWSKIIHSCYLMRCS
jgi:transposase-like protein